MPKFVTRITLIFLFVISLGNSFAQELPFIKEADKEISKDIRLAKLSISIFVVENIATTTMEMDFYNNTNRVKEGELNFPLGEGVTVSRFALDVNGEMREGVVVEKEKATQVFEAVTRQNIDPGILEMTKGNNFKARVYPIPAKGYKKAIIAYEQELESVNGEYLYNLPLNLKHKLSEFSVHVEVVKHEAKISLAKNDLINLKFDKEHKSYIAYYSSKNIRLDSHLGFVMPMPDKVEDIITYKGKVENVDFFYINTQPKQELREKTKPKKISIVWDASSSASKKNLRKELELLGKYFAWVKNVEIDVITFSNIIDETRSFNIEEGNWKELNNYLKEVKYDGGTQLGALDFSKINSNEILLFSDGLSNFGSKNIQHSTTPVVCINSNSTVNLNYLKYVAESTKGYLINLNDLVVNDALKLITYRNKQFIKAEYSSNKLFDVIPNRPSQYNNTFSIAGKVNSEKATIKLYFGYANEITETITYLIDNKSSIKNNLTERIWVQKKIAELSLYEDENEDEIKTLGKKFNIVTKNTSLIVLDNVEDYVEHEITPPKSLIKEYNKLLSIKKSEVKKSREKRLDTVYNSFKRNIDWWNKSNPYVEPNKLPKNEHTIDTVARIQHRDNSSEVKSVMGIVRADDDELPMPGVRIKVKGTDIGASTDFDGVFSIETPINAVLVFEFIGYSRTEIDISNLSNVEVTLQADTQVLDDVVVTGYGISRTRRALSGTVSGVQVDEEYEDLDDPDRIIKAYTKLNAWDSNAPYMNEIKASKKSNLYNTYYSVKVDYINTPSFFFDVASYMIKVGEKEMALKVISNLAEIELESHEILRSLGRKLSEFGFNEEAIYIFNEVLKIRSFEPQSYRDLGLAFAENGAYQEAINSLYKVIEKEWGGDSNSRFKGIEIIVLHEISSIIKDAKGKVDTSFIDERFLVNMPVDIRIVIDWDANDTDIDLWVTDPKEERCSYKNKETKIGGIISNDITTGYGPEEFLLKHAINGKYKIDANYFGSNKQSITGPVTIRAFLYSNFGRENEIKKVITIHVKEKGKEVINIGNMEFEIYFQ